MSNERFLRVWLERQSYKFKIEKIIRQKQNTQTEKIKFVVIRFIKKPANWPKFKSPAYHQDFSWFFNPPLFPNLELLNFAHNLLLLPR